MHTIESILKLALATIAGLTLAACSPDLSMQQQLVQQGCSVNAPDPRACDPADTKKTTICHIPPGNPANAHTLCVGNDAVPAHLQNHGDFVGTCACTGGDDGGVVDEVDAGAGSGSIDAGGGTGGGTKDSDGGIVL